MRRKENFLSDIEGKYGLSIINEETSSIKFSDIGYSIHGRKLKTSKISRRSDSELFFSNFGKV